jgi:hypothetical protein
MPTPRKSQKEIAQQYAGNRRYFKILHPLRRTRILLALLCLLASVVGAVIYFQSVKSSRRIEWLGSSGGISSAHSQFARDCKQCHDPALQPDLQNPAVLHASLDAKCEVCHVQHTFHQPDVATDRSCIDCHHEHLGTGPMQSVADNSCLSCHGNAELMAASAQKGTHLPASDFLVKPRDNFLVAFQPSRPAAGYTQVFQSFESGHPDFQIQREHLSDPNTLKFNHKVHLTGAVPEVDGHKLDCAYCHKPDGRGAYMQSITFAKNCQACHGLQIDPTLPDFQIPHPTIGGQAHSVRDFLLTLPTQYASYATEKKGMTDPAQVAAFVNEHMTGIRERVREGADLEKDVFFSDAHSIHRGAATPLSPEDRALFPGCAYCHEVKASPAQEPVITKPVTPDRWYVHARFDHAAHSTLNCNACHGQVLQSAKTSDISLPDKASCVTCHSAKGGVVSTCTTCHDYHNPRPVHGVAEASSLREMMLGKP